MRRRKSGGSFGWGRGWPRECLHVLHDIRVCIARMVIVSNDHAALLRRTFCLLAVCRRRGRAAFVDGLGDRCRRRSRHSLRGGCGEFLRRSEFHQLRGASVLRHVFDGPHASAGITGCLQLRRHCAAAWAGRALRERAAIRRPRDRNLIAPRTALRPKVLGQVGVDQGLHPVKGFDSSSDSHSPR